MPTTAGSAGCTPALSSLAVAKLAGAGLEPAKSWLTRAFEVSAPVTVLHGSNTS
jgi:hypothetical protein